MDKTNVFNEIYFLAIDIGASSGRHILFNTDGNKIYSEEVYRFKNGISEKDGELCWDLDYLFAEIKNGLKKCAESGKRPSYIGIDTWGVDFVLLDKNDIVVGNTVSYRDKRTTGIPEKVEKIISEMDLYKRTGIKKQIYNTIYQLYALSEKQPEHLKKAESLLMIPSYLSFLLSGEKYNEYTEASTTGLLNAKTKNWDKELIGKLGLNYKIFNKIVPAGTIIGDLKKEIADEIGFNAKIILPATHDTGSAVLAAPEPDAIFLSSGTWSLMGVVISKAIITQESFEAGLSNEGAFDGNIRFLKNIMGLWMLQSVKKELETQIKIYNFEELSLEAEKYKFFPSRVNVSDNRFLSPKSMIDEIKSFCFSTNQSVPFEVGEICSVIYQSLVNEYHKTVMELERITDKSFPSINIIGGGCKDEYLCRLIVEKIGKKITAGPAEATALGNALAQMIAVGIVRNIEEAKKIVRSSMDFKLYY